METKRRPIYIIKETEETRLKMVASNPWVGFTFLVINGFRRPRLEHLVHFW